MLSASRINSQSKLHLHIYSADSCLPQKNLEIRVFIYRHSIITYGMPLESTV